jgi:hypothetical protein
MKSYLLKLIIVLSDIAFSYTNPILYIVRSPYSTPIWWFTNGHIIVGVTDDPNCPSTKLIIDLDKHRYTSPIYNYPGVGIEADYGFFASLEFYKDYCKILVKNETDITDDDYIRSYKELSSISTAHYYTPVTRPPENHHHANEDVDDDSEGSL